MASVSLINLNVNNAELFKGSVNETGANTKLYLAYGKVNEWTNDLSPPAANSSIAERYSLWNNMIGGKKLTGNDIHHVIPRYQWTANTKYTAYDQLSTTLYDGSHPFYIVTSNNNVYKCLANNSGANSTVEPSYVSTNIGTTSDGYIWKYMYTLSDSERLRFTTSSYIPVKTLTSDDNSQQWQVQENAVDGAIYYIRVVNGGLNYNNIANVSVTITGDGTGAVAVPVLNTVTNTVQSITLTSYGSGYTWANTTVVDVGSGSGATIRALIGPKGGHGSDPLYELGGSYLLLNPKLSGAESGKLPAVNDYRQVAIIKNPTEYNGTTVFSNTTFSQTTDLTLASGGINFVQDEIVYQGATITDATFSGTVVQWDSSNNLIRLINTKGTPTTQILTGLTSLASRFVSSIKMPELEPYTGRVLYIDNITPITRNADQIEDFKIVLKF